MRKIFIITIFLFLFSLPINAQQIPPSYGFLEVVDSQNAPVADASICRGDCANLSKNQAQLLEKTNQKGLNEQGIALYGDYRMPFSIHKDGFYPFIDVFQSFKFLGYGWRNNKDKPIRIELLKIPQNKNEKKLIEKEQQKRELFLAIYNKDTEALRKLLKLKVNPNLKTSELRGVPISKDVSAIIYAADLANIEAIKELLSKGAKIRGKDSPENNILLNYLLADTNLYPPLNEEQTQRLKNYEDGVQILLNAGANIHITDERGYSLLRIAAEKGYVQIAETLLKNGLSGNEKNQKDLALLAGLRSNFYTNRYEMVKLLLKNGANPNFMVNDYDNSYNSGCTTALMLATDSADLEMVQLLIDYGANVNPICKNGDSAFTKALSSRFNYYDKSVEKKKEKILDLIFASGLDVKAVDDSGATLLMRAIQYSNFPMIEKLVKIGIPANAKTKRGETTLMIAVQSYSPHTPEVVKMLVEAGADVNAAFEYKNTYYENSYNFCYTPLFYAASGTYDDKRANTMTDLTQYLVNQGANVNYKCSNGETALTMTARAIGAVEGIKKLIELGADVKGEQGTLALKYAEERLKQNWTKETTKRVKEVVRILKEAGAKE